MIQHWVNSNKTKLLILESLHLDSKYPTTKSQNTQNRGSRMHRPFVKIQIKHLEHIHSMFQLILPRENILLSGFGLLMVLRFVPCQGSQNPNQRSKFLFRTTIQHALKLKLLQMQLPVKQN